MTSDGSSERAPWAIPPGALTEWLSLAAILDETGAVPCRTSDPEAWWPDRKDLDAPSTRGAVRACWRCPARAACLAYALAADERDGVWGGTLPDERRELVASLTEAGMSTRAIGSALGINDRTVRRDAGAANAAPDEPVDAEIVDEPRPRAYQLIEAASVACTGALTARSRRTANSRGD